MPFGLSGVYISESFGRVVQIVSSSFYDGLGNPIYQFPTQYTIISASYTIDETDNIIEVVVPFVTQSLPTAVGITGKKYSVINATTGSIMIQASGSETIGNSAVANDTYLIVLPQNAPLIISNNTNWRII